jgi:hypothetical protein
MVTTDATGFVGQLGQTIRANPIPAALVGVGVIWLLLASGTSAASQHDGK